jgi:hypothetical protein
MIRPTPGFRNGPEVKSLMTPEEKPPPLRGREAGAPGRFGLTGRDTPRSHHTQLVSAFLSVCLLLTIFAGSSYAQVRTPDKAPPEAVEASQARDLEIAARFAPVFNQGLGDKARNDYVTNFDFDGDWRGDNNWANSQDRRFPLRAYVYYGVVETRTHFFVHYAVFHPQDYKGGQGGPLLSQIIREGVKRGRRYGAAGLADEAVLAHENDLEGCLVVAAKAAGGGDELAGASVVYVETMAHNRFFRYAAGAARETGVGAKAEAVTVDGGRPRLYVEPKGHGVTAYMGGQGQTPRGGVLVYKYGGRADDPEAGGPEVVSYELLSMATTLWPRARGGVNETFGEVKDYGAVSVSAVDGSGREARRRITLGKLGSAFSGKVGAPNMARPPWGWFDRADGARAAGEWFFDPAAAVKKHFALGKEFSEVYVHAPLLGVLRR